MALTVAPPGTTVTTAYEVPGPERRLTADTATIDVAAAAEVTVITPPTPASEVAATRAAIDFFQTGMVGMCSPGWRRRGVRWLGGVQGKANGDQPKRWAPAKVDHDRREARETERTP